MKEPRVTQEQLDIMRHTIGLDKEKTPYRNYYMADRDHYNLDLLLELVEMGLMEKYQTQISSLYRTFCLTDQGCWMLGLSGKEALQK